ncbi:MAG: ABC transporter substrate-binding protein [Candidatus Zixiibacteriota bacterium]|nr:MAG: ABC transporter substrate-binding protein [candidate division Zixibacteria bacterium]
MINYVRKAVGIALAGLLWAGLCSSALGQRVEIAVLTGDSLTSTQRTLHGARKVITDNYPDANFSIFLISKDSQHNQRVVESVKNLRPRIILTIGSKATSAAQQELSDYPIVFSGVKYPVLSGFVESLEKPGRNITGASLDIPTDVQFGCFKKILPDMKKLGVLYTENTASLIPHASVVAARLGLELVAVNVDSDKDLPKALDSLALTVDGIWSVADPNLFKPQSTRYILLNTVRRGMPFMGFSRYVVESGALFALDFDYKAVGFQAGDIANKIIAGEKPENVRVTAADVIWFHYNENTARRINVDIPEELASVAKEVYR